MKRSTKDKLTMAASVTLVLAFVALAIGCEINVWQECRQTNSWFYCMRVLSK
jgi:hypothetical protein